MIATRAIPCLLLQGQGLVKTTRFKEPKYLGDPINIVKIFNEKEADELVILDIRATMERRGPPFELLGRITTECFMPLGYGGGIRSVNEMGRLFHLGVEKVVVNSHAVENPALVSDGAQAFGSQSIIASIDVRRGRFGGYRVYTQGGRRRTKYDPVSLAQEMEDRGAGELLVNSIDRDGTMQGYDLELIHRVSSAVSIPVVVCGGAGSLADMGAAVREGGASAAAAGSIFVFQGPHRAVLISYPKADELRRTFAPRN